MFTCQNCQTVNPPGNRFCQGCGNAIEAPTPAPGATVRWTGGTVPLPAPRRTVPVAALFGQRKRIVIGRATDCDVCLAHPSVSRYHALLELRPEGLRLRDLGSVNGVSVAGVRITEPVLIEEGQRVGIGPFLFTLREGVIQALDSSRSLRLEARGIEKVVPVEDGQVRKLLEGISLVVNPGEFVSLLGPSGSGKSTLMDCLNGRRRATAGLVLANGEDFYRHFDSFRQSLGYVPQRDIVHTQLTVYRALYYTARLRLPVDTAPAEIHARLEKVLAEMELGPHRDTLVANLSGGQVKRVSLGAELLAEPCMLYIDEATSGLDAGTEARMMRLFRGLADQGRSIVCITHNVDHVEECHLAVVLCKGRLIYCGPPREAPAWFGVGRISEIYDRLGEKSPEQWSAAFAGSDLHRAFVASRLALPGGTAPPSDSPTLVRLPVTEAAPAVEVEPLPVPAQGPALAERFRALTARVLRARVLLSPLKEAWHQVRVLTARYVELIRGDARGLRLLLLQAPLVALFLLVGFVNKDYRAKMPIPRPLTDDERQVLAALVGLDLLLSQEGEQGQKEALAGAHFKVEIAGKEVNLDGSTALSLLRQLQRQAGLPVTRLALAQAKFTFEARGLPVTVTGADISRVFDTMRGSKLPARLLSFEGPIVPDHDGINPRYTYILLFLMVMIVLWFGCNNAAKEIVKEEAIYGRERAVNLRIAPYLVSKFTVMTLITIAHALILMVLVYGTLELLAHWLPNHSAPPPELRLNYLGEFGVLALLSACGVALGLLLSACVSTPDRANALLPYVLIPQIILSGGLMSVEEGPLHWLAVTLSPVYWAYRAVRCGGQLYPEGFPGHVPYPDGALLPCAVLVVQTVALLALTAWFLRGKDA